MLSEDYLSNVCMPHAWADTDVDYQEQSRIITSLETEEKLNATEAVKRPCKDRMNTLITFNSYLIKNIKLRDEGGSKSRVSGYYGRKHFSKKTLEELKPIALKDMMVPNIHWGSCLVCRTVGASFTTFGVNSLVEDSNGDVEYLELFNFQVDLRDDPNAFLPTGQILLIKEPYLKYGNTTEIISIRCDSPSDVIFLNKYDERLAELAPSWFVQTPVEEDTFDYLKELGNDFYRLQRYEDSIKYYNRALLIEPANGTLFLNKSAAYLQLNRFWEAYTEAKRAYEQSVNDKNIDEVKALFRMGKAAYGMRDWNKALEHYSTLLDRHPGNGFAPEELKKTKKRIEESQTGKYDLKFMFDFSEKDSDIYVARSLDVADYTGPVKVVDIEGKGKGLVTTKAVAKGTLLFACKAVSYCGYVSPFHTIYVNVKDDYLYGKRMSLTVVDENVIFLFHTIRMLRDNPNRGDDLYSLYAENIDRNEVVPFGVIDPSRTERICYSNLIVPSDGLCSLSALYILFSFVNHSCLPNSHHEFYGDFVMVHATKDLKEGEEVTVSYWSPHSEPYQRRVELAYKSGFRCDCRLCKLDAPDTFCERREEIIKEMIAVEENMAADPVQALDEAIKLANAMRSTYRNRTEIRYRLGSSLFVLGRMYLTSCDLRRAIECLKEALEELKDLKYEFTEIQAFLAVAYKNSGRFEFARECLLKAFDNERIAKGVHSIELFKHFHRSALNNLEIHDFI